jgi:NitT/TauT family transport system substrate-binding protein
VETVFIAASSRAVQALISGDLEIIQGAAPTVVEANLLKAELVMIGTQYDKLVQSFFVVPSIARVKDLKGKAIGVSRFGSVSDFAARYIIRRYGMEPVRDVALVQTGGIPEMLAAMQNNLIQGGMISLPSSLKAKRLGMRELLSPGEIGLDFDMGTFIVTRSLLRERRDELKKFLRAIVEAFDLANQDPAIAKTVLARYTKTDDREVLDATYVEYVKKYARRIPLVSLPGLKPIIDFIGESRPEAKRLRPEEMLDNSILRELEGELGRSR